MGTVGRWWRRAAKDACAAAVHGTGLRTALASYRRLRAGGRRVLIVSYHRVVDDVEGELKRSIPGLLISAATFRRQLEQARAQGFELASLDDAIDVLAGARQARRDLCVITFDDGYRDVYLHAFPILRAMGVPATVYLASELVGTRRRFAHDRLFHLAALARQRGQRLLYAPSLTGTGPLDAALDGLIGRMRSREVNGLIGTLEQQLGGGPELSPEHGELMSWDEARRMSEAGIHFGAHTMEHVVLAGEDPQTVERELCGSKERIERELGRAVRDFAYCNGWYSNAVIRALVRCGFRSAVTTEDLPNVVGGDLFALKRKVMWENFSVGAFGAYSPALTACQLDDVFGALGATRPVLGHRELETQLA